MHSIVDNSFDPTYDNTIEPTYEYLRKKTRMSQDVGKANHYSAMKIAHNHDTDSSLEVKVPARHVR